MFCEEKKPNLKILNRVQAVENDQKKNIDFSNVPIECKVISLTTPNFEEGAEKLNINIMGELLKGNAIFWTKVRHLTNLTKAEKDFIWDHIDVSRFENPARDKEEAPFDIHDKKSPHIGLGKQLYIIPNCTLDHPFFTIKHHCHQKPDQSTFRFWKEGDARSNGEGWIRPNNNTFRFTVSLPLVIATKDVTYQMEISEFDGTKPHQRPYADMMNLDVKDVPLSGKWDKCFIYERTRVDITKSDGLKKIRFFQFFKEFNGGVLVKTMQFAWYNLPVPVAIQNKCIKALAVKFENPVENRKFVSGILTQTNNS